MTDSDSDKQDGETLYQRTLPYAHENRLLSWWLVATTFISQVAAMAGAGLFEPLWARLLCCGFLCLNMVRCSSLSHDFMHGSILRKSPVATFIFYLWGLMVLVPPSMWRYSHNFHHARNMRIESAHIGSYPVMTVRQWKRATPEVKRLYVSFRSFRNICLAYFRHFLYGFVIKPIRIDKRRDWDLFATIPVQVSVYVATYLLFGWLGTVLAWLVPVLISSAIYAFLFYIQHNFPGMYVLKRKEWTIDRAAFESTSFFKVPRIVRYFLANITHHHIHHINSNIPFYNLPRVMQEVEAFQHPLIMRLTLSDIRHAFTHHIWDPDAETMLRYRDVPQKASE